MKFLVVLVALCLAAPAFSTYANYGGYNGGYNHGGYHGPLASPVVTPNGFLADTPEVAAAKAAHFSEVAKANSAPGYNHGAYASAPAPAPAYHGGYAAAGRYAGPLASPVVTPSGFLADTPEVAAAKAAHFSEVAKTQGAPGHYAAPHGGYAAPHGAYAAAYDDGSYKPELYERESHSGAYSAPAHAGGYHGPLASPVVTPSGFLADTPEVAAAKAAHFSEVAKNQGHGYHGRYRRGVYRVYAPLAYSARYVAPVYPYAHRVYHYVVLVALCLAAPAFSTYASYGGYNQGGYHGPLASPVVTPNGFLADTPEVAAAKAAHFSEVAKVSSAPGYSHGAYASAPAPAPAYHGGYAAAGRYAGPLASPVVTPSGFLADTPEVAAAKAAHFSEVAKSQGAPGHYAAPHGGYAAPHGAYAAAYDDGSYKPELYERESHSGAYSAPAHAGGYHGPLASPVVTPSGFLADTPEVAAAKAAHFSEVAKNQGHGYHGRYRRGVYRVYAPLAYSARYVAPVYPYAHRVYHY